MSPLVFSFLPRAQWPEPRLQIPVWQSHRGFTGSGQTENTLGALAASADLGAEMVEFDVRLTKDQVPVLFHDKGFVENLSLKEILEQRDVTTLEEVLLSKRVPRFLNIEIKSDEVMNNPLERRVAEVLAKTQHQKFLLFSSFNPFTLWKMQSLCPLVPRALLASSQMKDIYLREFWLAPFLNFQLLHLDAGYFDQTEWLRLIQSKGYKVAAWTINENAQIKKFLDLGVDSVITDLIYRED